MDEMIGKWAFIIGIVLAVLAAFVQIPLWLVVLLGLVVGFLNITSKESHEFLLATVALMIVGSAGVGVLGGIGTSVTPILNNLVVFVAPAALVVALKAVYGAASSK